MVPQAMSSTEICSGCERPATKHCARCEINPFVVGHKMTRYCSIECQQSQWSEHKDYCNAINARRRLERAGNMIQSVFFAFREFLFDMEIEDVKIDGSKISIHEHRSDASRLFSPFPNELIKDPSTKKAMLSFLACNEALLWTRELVSMTIEATNAEYHEMTLDHKPSLLDIESIDCKTKKKVPTNRVHHVAVFRMKDKNEFVLDVTCEQYGYSEPTVPLFRYTDERIANTIDRFLEKSSLEEMREQFSASDDSHAEQVIDVQIIFKQALDKEVTKYLAAYGGNLHVILDSPQAEYEKHCENLVTKILAGMREIKDIEWLGELMGSQGGDTQ